MTRTARISCSIIPATAAIWHDSAHGARLWAEKHRDHPSRRRFGRSRVVRASMGAAFSLNVRHFDSFEQYRAQYPLRRLFPFMLTGAVPLDEAVQKVDGPFSLVFGNEASGLPDEFAQIGVSTLIPHSQQIDSLNLAIAAGIGMYAFTRK
ncbi:MAG: TrmH family RNA methyltransferase [Christensenellales bacterium]